MADDVDGLAQHFSRFLCSHATEIPHLDELGQGLVFSSKGFNRGIELDELEQFDAFLALHLQAGGPGRVPIRATGSLLAGACSRVVDQNLPHDSGSYGQKMDLVGEPAFRAVGQLQVNLMDKGSSLECVIRAFPRQVAGGNPVEFLVQSRCEFLHYGMVPDT